MGGKRVRPLLHIDARLMPRIKDLIFKQNKDADEITLLEELQTLYPEYKRKKANVLKFQVKMCLEEIAEEDSGAEINGLDGTTTMETSTTETGFYIDNQPSDFMNNSLAGIYKRNTYNGASPQKPSTLSDGQVDSALNTPIKPFEELGKLRLDSESQESKFSRIISKASRDSAQETKRRKVMRKSMNESSVTDEAQEAIDKVLEKQQKIRAKYLVEPTSSFEQFGGLDDQIVDLKRCLNHFLHSNIPLYDEDFRGLLIQGPPGVGKTAMIEAAAAYLNIPLFRVTLTGSENSEKVISEVFELAKSMQPSLLVLDKLDFVCSKSDANSNDKDRSIVSHLIKCFESLPKFDDCKLLVIGVTSKLDKIDSEIKHLFEATLKIDLPNETARVAIIEKLFRTATLSGDINAIELAQRTPGFVARDYKNLLKTAKHYAIERIASTQEEMEGDKFFRMEPGDLGNALAVVQPLFKNEGFATVPKVSWSDIGALKHARALLKLRILDRVRHKTLGNALNLNDPVGILMYGPPGCGKTLLAKAIANEADINFISVRGPELLNKYVGESERAVRELFARANHSKPCLIFFDEFDAISKAKSDNESNASTNVVKQLLTEMDGFNARSCFMLAATNRPDLIDPAIMRPGRFGKGIFIGFPEPDERSEILKAITKHGSCPRCASDVDFDVIALDSRLDGFSGADLKEFVTIASEVAFKEMIEKIEAGEHHSIDQLCVSSIHFELALRQVQPSLSAKERKAYEKLRIEFENRSKA